MIGTPDMDLKAVREEFFGDIPVGIEPNKFVGLLDMRISDILEKWVDYYLTGSPWDTLEQQLEKSTLRGGARYVQLIRLPGRSS